MDNSFIEQVSSWVDSLGDSKEAVYQKLKEQDCRGPINSTCCPVAVYLKRKLTDLGNFSVYVNPGRINIVDLSDHKSKIGFSPSSPVQCFIAAFDNRDYPDLLIKDQQ